MGRCTIITAPIATDYHSLLLDTFLLVTQNNNNDLITQLKDNFVTHENERKNHKLNATAVVNLILSEV